jgi:hypothetical protein
VSPFRNSGNQLSAPKPDKEFRRCAQVVLLQIQLPARSVGIYIWQFLYLTTVCYFSTSIKSPKSKLKREPQSPTTAPQNALPTIYELSSLAVQLYRNAPETKNVTDVIQLALEFWMYSNAKISGVQAFEAYQKFLDESKKKILEQIKPPKKFPVSHDKMIHGLLPKRDKASRKKICAAFCRSFYNSDFPNLEHNIKSFVDRRFEKSLTMDGWKQRVFLFQTWFPAYDRDVRIEKAKKAAASRKPKNNLTR